MAKLSIKPASTSVPQYIFVGNSSVTTGAGLTGLVFNSAGLVAYYVRPLAAATAITLVTQTVTGAFSSGGFVEVDATNMPGVYRVDVPDAAFASGVRNVIVMLKGATNMVPVVMEFDLKAEVDSVAGAVGSVTGLTASNLDTTVSSRMATYTQPTGFLAATFPASVASPTNITGGTITTVTTLTNLPAITANWLTAAGIAADAITDAKVAADVTIASVSGAVGSVTGAVGSLAAQAKADVKAEVVAALITDTYAEGASVPATTASLKDKINWLYTLARNRVTQTATTQTLRNSGNTLDIATSTDSDDATTLIRGAWV